MSDEMLTTSEAARRLGVQRTTVLAWLAQGKVPGARRHGRDWMIPASDLEGMSRGRGGIPVGSKRKKV